jgi:hypothetical protein
MKVKELTLRDTEELLGYTEGNPDVIYTQTYNMLNHTWKKNKKISMVDLFIITLTDDEEMDEIILTVNDDEWEPALEMALVYFEEVENYEKCIEIKKLLETIN